LPDSPAAHLPGGIDTVYKYLYTSLVSEKSIFWVASSLDDVRSFPEDARRLAGHFLHLVQQGLDPPDWKPMAALAKEFMKSESTRALNIVSYTSRSSAKGIYVLHAFQKKTRTTSASDIDLARRRLKQLVGERGSQRDQG
jgi:phage-related protein